MLIGTLIDSLVQNICGKLRSTAVRARKWNGRVGPLQSPVAGSSMIVPCNLVIDANVNSNRAVNIQFR